MKLKNKKSGSDRRHKCSICGKVRFEKFMRVIELNHRYGSYEVKTRYGNYCWYCVDNPDCEHKSLSFSSY